MPSSAVRTVTDPDDYAASIRATSLELTVTGRGHFAGKVIRIDLHRLWMQRVFKSLPQISHSSLVPGRAVISFWTDPGSAWNGSETLPSKLARHSDANTPIGALPALLIGPRCRCQSKTRLLSEPQSRGAI